MKPFVHATNSAVRFGGKMEDYLPIHNFIDESKAHIADSRHRALLHNTFGCFIVEKLFGSVATNSEGKLYSPRDVAEQHIIEDLGTLPTVQDWLSKLPIDALGQTASSSALDKYKRAAESLAEAKAQAADEYFEDLSKRFEAVAWLNKVEWTQGTPSFNDGDPCVFGVHSYNINTLDEDEEEDEDKGWTTGEQDKQFYDSFGYEPDCDQDLCLVKFGDGTKVTWRRGEGFSTEEYEMY